jgi:hypothetical protein
MKPFRLWSGFAAVLALVLWAGLAQADVTLPAPEDLVTMTIQQRLALFQSMDSLPTNQRDANLTALRGEINQLTPKQKQEMADRFKAELQAMPPEQQEALQKQLQQMGR